mgnify:CR=1 FL=1
MMKIFKIFIYLSVTLLIICVPLYSGARILLPGWLKEYISSSLPSGSELQIGEMISTPNLGISYKDLVFRNNNENFQINLKDIILEPNISISKPVNFKISSGIIRSKDTEFIVTNLNGKILVSSYRNKDFSILGNLSNKLKYSFFVLGSKVIPLFLIYDSPTQITVFPYGENSMPILVA